MPRAALHALAVLLTTATAFGADHRLLGDKLLVKTAPSGALNNKMVLLANRHISIA